MPRQHQRNHKHYPYAFERDWVLHQDKARPVEEEEMPSKDPVKRNAAQKRYYRKNRLAILARRSAWVRENNEKIAVRNAKYYADNKEAARWNQIKINYGITKDDYLAMLERQGGVCATCGNPPTDKPLCVDHDHTTGVVRGLLCHRCNKALGWVM